MDRDPVSPLGDGLPDAPGEPDGAGVANASVQQSGTGVASGAGLKFGSRQPVNVSGSPVAGSMIGSRVRRVALTMYSCSLVARRNAISSSICR